MKIKKSLIGKFLIRLAALMITVSLVPSSLCLEVHAEPESEQQTQAQQQAQEREAALQERNAQQTDASSMEIYKNGEVYQAEVKTGVSWDDNSVKGSTDPTSKALSAEEFNSGRPSLDAVDDLYTLTVSTGVKPGTTIQYFAIRYTDTNGAAQTKYIFPTKERQNMVSDYIKNISGNVPGKVWKDTTITGVKRRKELIGPDEYKDVFEPATVTVKPDRAAVEAATREFYDVQSVVDNYVDGQVKMTGSKFLENLTESHKSLRELGYTINENTTKGDVLDAWSTEELLFKTDTAIKSVNGIDVFMSGGSWTVQGMCVSRVTSIGGYGEYGYYSGKYFLALGKQRISELQSKKTGTQTFNANGDTLINIGGDSSLYFGLKQLNESATSASQFNDLYSFRLDFSDVLDGGIENLLRNDPNNSDPAAGPVAEHLALEISYKDKNNWTRTVTVPVLLSVLGQYKRTNDTVRTAGLAQRGDTLAFTACLPEYSSLISTRLFVGKAARDKIASEGGIAPTGTSRERERLITALDSDYIRVAGISMYKGTCRMSNTQAGEDAVSKAKLISYTYTFDFSESAPILYNTSANLQGIRINPGASDTFKMVAYKQGAPLIGAEDKNNILIRVKTDSINGAQPTGTTRIRLTYHDTSGSEMTSPYYSISNEVMNYLGYWPASDNARSNFGYNYSTQPGNIVEFPVQLSDVGAITSVELSVGSDSGDWQVSGVSVAALHSMGKRRIYAQPLRAGTASSGYRIVRTMNSTVIPPFPVNMQLLVTSGDSFAFNTGEGTLVTARETDFNSVRYSMSYEQTKENYGFARVRKTYDINVKVADDPDAGNFNGDSGSSNHFYFQLLFKSGKSAFVLANQQLSSDAFRAGCDETFAIAINRDYGEVTGVRIIPEDVTEDSDVFDKLNIEQMTVTERTSGGSADQFVFDNVGWIGIDYNDKSQDAAVKAREGRSLSAVAKSFKTSYKQKVINLLCEIKSLPWDTDYMDVEASVSCDLNYVDTQGQPRTVSFDVISRMASYMNKTAKAFDGGEGADSAIYKNMGTISDPHWMLRPNHTDRFILPSLTNVKSISSMTFKATSRNNKISKWIIGGISISRIKSDSGVVTLTASNNSTDGEYLRSMQTIPLCEMIKKGGKEYEELLLPAGEAQKLTVYFSDNTISWAENTSWASSVSKFPESTNDTLNVYLFPSASTRNIENVAVGAAVQFNISDSRVMQVKQSMMNVYASGTENAMFYFNGLTATGMKNISSLSIQCRNTKVSFDHAIVQQVREGVVVTTYSFDFGGASATLGLKALPSSFTKVYDPKKQKLLLSLGTDTTEMSLFGLSDDNLAPNDIAVCLKYKSTLDPNTEYYSPYVYLTEAGINKIYPGMMAEVGFNVPYLSQITGYRIISFGNIKATVESAMGINYSCSESDPKAVKLEECFSFNQSFATSNIQRELTGVTGMTGEKSVTPLDFYFTSAKAADNAESGINVPVSAEFTYTDSMNAEKTKVIGDIRQYIQSADKQFKTGERTLVRLFLPDFKELNSIRLTPSSGSWKIDSIEAYRLEEELINRKVDTVFTEEGSVISLRRVSLSTTVTAADIFKGRVENHEKNIKIDGGRIVSGSVLVNNSKAGFDMRVDMLSNDILTDITDEVASRDDTAFAVTIPRNQGSVPMTYSITIWAVDNPTIKDVINVTVVPSSQPTYIIRNNTSDSSDTSSSNTDQNNAQEQSDEQKSSQGRSDDDTAKTDTNGQ